MLYYAHAIRSSDSIKPMQARSFICPSVVQPLTPPQLHLTVTAPTAAELHLTPLYGAVDAAASTYKVLGSKIEVALVKKHGGRWGALFDASGHAGECMRASWMRRGRGRERRRGWLDWEVHIHCEIQESFLRWPSGSMKSIVTTLVCRDGLMVMCVVASFHCSALLRAQSQPWPGFLFARLLSVYMIQCKQSEIRTRVQRC